MYYHCRPLKHVVYGKIYGNPNPDEDFARCYKWLGNHCGFFPQVWLSRSRSGITGVRNDKTHILFAFENIIGFGLHYDWWDNIISSIWEYKYTGKDPIKDVKGYNDHIWKKMKKLCTPDPGYEKDYEEWIVNDLQSDPRDFDSADEWLKKAVFVKRDQVVVPSLNLKAAKEVFCRSEKEKKKLRKMGFIEDRIKLRKFPNGWG